MSNIIIKTLKKITLLENEYQGIKKKLDVIVYNFNPSTWQKEASSRPIWST